MPTYCWPYPHHSCSDHLPTTAPLAFYLCSKYFQLVTSHVLHFLESGQSRSNLAAELIGKFVRLAQTEVVVDAFLTRFHLLLPPEKSAFSTEILNQALSTNDNLNRFRALVLSLPATTNDSFLDQLLLGLCSNPNYSLKTATRVLVALFGPALQDYYLRISGSSPPGDSTPAVPMTLWQFLLTHKVFLVRVYPLPILQLLLSLFRSIDEIIRAKSHAPTTTSDTSSEAASVTSSVSLIDDLLYRMADVWSDETFARHCPTNQQQYMSQIVVSCMELIERRTESEKAKSARVRPEEEKAEQERKKQHEKELAGLCLESHSDARCLLKNIRLCLSVVSLHLASELDPYLATYVCSNCRCWDYEH